LVEDADEQATIARIREDHRIGCGLREIARRIAVAGIACRGGRWSHTPSAQYSSGASTLRMVALCFLDLITEVRRLQGLFTSRERTTLLQCPMGEYEIEVDPNDA
jgi:hypothetical protein